MVWSGDLAVSRSYGYSLLTWVGSGFDVFGWRLRQKIHQRSTPSTPASIRSRYVSVPTSPHSPDADG